MMKLKIGRFISNKYIYNIRDYNLKQNLKADLIFKSIKN